MGRADSIKLKIISWKTKFLQYHRLTVFPRYRQMFVNIVFRLSLCIRHFFLKTIRQRPAPIIRPNMDVHIINIHVCMYSLKQSQVFFTAVFAFASCGNQMIGVQRADQCRCSCHPSGKRLFVFLPRTHEAHCLLAMT